MSDKIFKIVNNDMSDGYHTFDELYDHRCLLYILVCLQNRFVCAWRPDFEGWFVLYFNSYAGQISYHIPNKYLSMVEKEIVRNDDCKWDCHTSPIVLERMIELCGGVKNEPERNCRENN